MNIFIPFEVSGKVRRVMRRLGHNAWSCDTQEPDDNSNYHLHGDYRRFINYLPWDMMIAFPVCTHVALCGNRWYAGTELRRQGVQNFVDVYNLPIKRKCLENPKGVISTKFKKWTQVIHPWEHGHREIKPTCLWLVNLPKIKPTKNVGPPPLDKVERRKWEKIWTATPSNTRQKDRSETYDGIAEAFGIHWGGLEVLQ